MPDIKPPKNNPLNMSPITRVDKILLIHDNDFFINKSNTI